ncbi:MAG: hypothetical protein NZ700_16870, partial [Gemmataceae bacterium]|nr:hypothetical protein [Gemmataceae bacterium]
MKPRRQRLHVSTFPFLAVLLCAMGSLILLLLVMDRRAKVVARAKALAAVERRREAEARAAAAALAQAAAQRAEWERRRQALLARLQAEEAEISRQLAEVHGQLQTASSRAEVARTRLDQMQASFRREQARLQQRQHELAARRAELASQVEKTTVPQAELARFAASLDELEQTLERLRTLRKREEQTYSVVPYRGKHGEPRRPLYIECAADGLIFHPDRSTLTGLALSPHNVRTEVERRLARRPPDKRDQVPYVLMLVRPDGIANYYEALAALDGMRIDFGYEFVEREWVLDFPEDEAEAAPQPWMSAAAGRANRPTVSAPEGSWFSAETSGVGVGLPRGLGGAGSGPPTRGSGASGSGPGGGTG